MRCNTFWQHLRSQQELAVVGEPPSREHDTQPAADKECSATTASTCVRRIEDIESLIVK